MPCTLQRGAIPESESLKCCLWDEKPLNSRCPESSRCDNQGCTSPMVIFAHLPYFCYGTQVQLFTAQKPIIQELTVSRKGWCFNQKIHQSGEKVDSCLETDLENSSEPWKDFKGENGELSQWLTEAWGCVQHESFFWCYLACVICLQGC